MLIISRTFDMHTVRAILTHPSIWPHIIDDGTPGIEDFEPCVSDAIYYLAVHKDGALVGIFMCIPENCITLDVHTNLLPSCRGALAVEAATRALQWVRENTSFTRIVTKVPDNNPLALRLAERVGFTRYGHNPDSFMQNGVLMGQTLLGLCLESAA